MSKPKESIIESSEKQKITANLYTRFLKNEMGRLELALIVDEKTTISELEKAWNNIKHKANQMLEVQGSDPNDYYVLSRLKLATLYFLDGFSYTEVAMDANYDTLVNLVQIISDMEEGKREVALATYQAVYQRLDGLGLKSAEIHGWIKESLEEVRQGRAPWSLTDGPVTKQRIVVLVRQLERDIKQGNLVIKKDPPGQRMMKGRLGDIADANSKYWETAKDLLRQLPKSGGLTKLEKAHKRYFASRKG